MRNVSVVNKSSNSLPKYETPGSAGLDLRSNEELTLAPGERCLVHTGLYVAIPEGYEMQVRPRSGLALKNGITVLNSPGTIDSDYRGEVCIIIINHGDDHFNIHVGDKIAQGVLCPVEQIKWNEVEELDSTERGTGGFGHTGV